MYVIILLKFSISLILFNTTILSSTWLLRCLKLLNCNRFDYVGNNHLKNNYQHFKVSFWSLISFSKTLHILFVQLKSKNFLSSFRFYLWTFNVKFQNVHSIKWMKMFMKLSYLNENSTIWHFTRFKVHSTHHVP